MKNQKWLVLVIVLGLIACTAGAITWLKANKRLGKPGIRAVPIPGSVVMNIALPERVLDFTSTNLPQDAIVLGWLPKDTSYAQRLYTGSDGIRVDANVILMGADRTSIHKADLCLPGQGWQIIDKAAPEIAIEGPQPYRMPVAKWTVSRLVRTQDGRQVEQHALYVFWFVADNEQTVDNDQRLWWLVRDLMRTGVLQRWAYISYFTGCAPGQEDAAFDRVSKLIAGSVPDFQLPPRTAGGSSIARQ
jgi:hypothetical protein